MKFITIKDLKDCYSNLEKFAMSQLDDIYRTQVDVGRETVNQAMEMARTSSDAEKIVKNLEKASEIVIGAVSVLKIERSDEAISSARFV